MQAFHEQHCKFKILHRQLQVDDPQIVNFVDRELYINCFVCRIRCWAAL